VAKLFTNIALRMKERPGGYTRVIKLGERFGDAAEVVILELVDYQPDTGENSGKSGKKTGAARKEKAAQKEASKKGKS
jgi:large subunit ribosomal protein L17